MIKHLSPKSEKEIEAFVKNEIVDLAKAKLPVEHKKISANYCIVYVHGSNIGPYSFQKYAYNVIYKVTFSRQGFFDKWKLYDISKLENTLMNKNWYSTQLLTDIENIRRPYD